MLANQLYCSEDVPTNSEEQDEIDFECGILEQKLISHMRTNKHSNANSFSESLELCWVTYVVLEMMKKLECQVPLGKCQ